MEIVLSDSSAHQIKYHIYRSGFFCLSVPFTMLCVAELSVATGVGGCGWTIYAGVVHMEVVFWKFSNSPPN